MKQEHIQNLGSIQNCSEEIHQVLSAKCKRGLKLQAKNFSVFLREKEKTLLQSLKFNREIKSILQQNHLKS